MAGKNTFQLQELELHTILELRARCVHLLERAEYHIQAGNSGLGEVLIGIAASTPEHVRKIVSHVIEKWAGVDELASVHSEMYRGEVSLADSLDTWSEIFSRGSDDPFEDIQELEDEVNICFEVEESE